MASDPASKPGRQPRLPEAAAAWNAVMDDLAPLMAQFPGRLLDDLALVEIGGLASGTGRGRRHTVTGVHAPRHFGRLQESGHGAAAGGDRREATRAAAVAGPGTRGLAVVVPRGDPAAEPYAACLRRSPARRRGAGVPRAGPAAPEGLRCSASSARTPRGRCASATRTPTRTRWWAARPPEALAAPAAAPAVCRGAGRAAGAAPVLDGEPALGEPAPAGRPAATSTSSSSTRPARCCRRMPSRRSCAAAGGDRRRPERSCRPPRSSPPATRTTRSRRTTPRRRRASRASST